MATLNHYTYDYYEGGTLSQPGQTQTYHYGGPPANDPDGPWFNWSRKAVVASAQPFDATGQDRTLVVERIGHRSIDPGKRYVTVTIRNVGVAATAIWYVTLGVVSA